MIESLAMCYMILWSIVYVASCHLEILSAHIASGIAERKTRGVSFTDLAMNATLLGITAEVMRLNMLKLSLCLMIYCSGPSFIRPYLSCRNDSFVRVSVHCIRLIEQFCTEMSELQFHFNYLNILWVQIVDRSLY